MYKRYNTHLQTTICSRTIFVGRLDFIICLTDKLHKNKHLQSLVIYIMHTSLAVGTMHLRPCPNFRNRISKQLSLWRVYFFIC